MTNVHVYFRIPMQSVLRAMCMCIYLKYVVTVVIGVSVKYTFDGLHLNKLGYQEWAKVLEDFIIDKGMGDFIK